MRGTTSSSQDPDRFKLAGTDLENRYRVIRVVAEGGFGIVYEAMQIALDRRVALKILKTPDLDDVGKKEFVDKFASEAKTIARMAHPSIVQVYDFGVSTMPNGELSAWMALEWLTGHTLESDLYRRRGQPGRSPMECLQLMTPVLEAIAFAHQNGIAHRDLKPANIMVVDSISGAAAGTAGAQFKVLDFGIAKLMDVGEVAEMSGPTRTPAKLIAYSPAYAAPEQISHARTGPWTDVHALALILVEMLTNQPIFTANDLPSLFSQILDATRPTPRTKGVDVGAWEPVLVRALAVAPTSRHPTAGDLLRALRSDLSAPASPIAASVIASEKPITPAPAPAPAAISTTASPVSQEDPPVVPTHGRSGAVIGLIAGAVVVLAVVGVALKLHFREDSNKDTPPPSTSVVLPSASVAASVVPPASASSSAAPPPSVATSASAPSVPPPPTIATPTRSSRPPPPPSAGRKEIPVE